MNPDRSHFRRWLANSVATFVLACVGVSPAPAAENVQHGAQVFRQCAACHTLEAGRNLTGPTLANLFGRKAGSVSSFLRYSDALERSSVVWNEQTLDAWLKAPDRFIPGNDMAFPGIKDDQARRDLIAYLKSANKKPVGQPLSRRLPDLKKAGPEDIVKSIRHCRDTYFVATRSGDNYKIWEFNMRFKTDTSASGPGHGKPVITGAGMRGDRAFIIFSSPKELGSFIEQRCE